MLTEVIESVTTGTPPTPPISICGGCRNGRELETASRKAARQNSTSGILVRSVDQRRARLCHASVPKIASIATATRSCKEHVSLGEARSTYQTLARHVTTHCYFVLYVNSHHRRTISEALSPTGACGEYVGSFALLCGRTMNSPTPPQRILSKHLRHPFESVASRIFGTANSSLQPVLYLGPSSALSGPLKRWKPPPPPC